MVQEHLDGTIHIVYRDREVLFTEIKELPQKLSIRHQKQQIPGLRKKHVPPSGSSLEKVQHPISTHQSSIACMRSTEDISNESKGRTFLTSLDKEPTCA